MEAAPQKVFGILTAILCLNAGIAWAQEDALPPPPPLELLISIADQKLVVLKDGGVIGKYRISTSRFGAGDSYGSYKTPLGKLRVCDKIGGDLSPGAVIKHRSATGEVIAVNAPGRDPIVTRVIWLDGLEEQNHNARARGIYIHGTPEENNLGKPMSWGCIRMRSEDVIQIYDEIPTGTLVDIIPDRLPRLHKYKPPPPPPPPVIIAANPTPAPPAKPAPASKAAASVAPAIAKVDVPPPAAPASSRLFAKKSAAGAASAGVPPVAENAASSSEEYDSPRKTTSGRGDAWKAMSGSILLAGLPGAPSASAKPSPAP